MADSVDVQFLNQAAWDGLIAGLVRDLGDLNRPLSDGGDALVTSARAAAPHRTGRMAAATTGSYSGHNRYTVTVAHPGAAAVHWGWPAHGIRRQPWIVARWWKDPSPLDRLGAGVQGLLDDAAAKVT